MELRVGRGGAAVTAQIALWCQTKQNFSLTVMLHLRQKALMVLYMSAITHLVKVFLPSVRSAATSPAVLGVSHCHQLLLSIPHPALCWHADLAEVLKGIRALAPNSPDIAVALDSNQQLVDNYVKVIVFALQACLATVVSVHCRITKPNPLQFCIVP